MKENVTVSEKDTYNFKKIFANLPEKIRKEDVIFVLDKKPYTWNVVFLEISKSTSLGIKMLKKLKELEII